VTAGSSQPPVTVEVTREIPDAWDGLLATAPAHDLTHTRAWLALLADTVPGASLRLLLATHAGQITGGLAAVARRRRGLDQLESSHEGQPGGPVLAGGLPAAVRQATLAALCRAYADLLGGRTALVTQTLAEAQLLQEVPAVADARWQATDFTASVVDCRGGLEHVERELWTNNRRNERNRGLKRGCVLAVETDPAVVEEWYPLYRRVAVAWAQDPVPAALVAGALRRAPERFLMTTCRRDGELLGGHVLYRWDDRLVAWQSAVRPESLRELFTTTLLYWQDVTVTCTEGRQALDFGGNVGRDSLADFKRRCGGRPEPRRQLVAASRLGRLLRGVRGRLRRDRGRRG
jgi:hypothetical protein